MADSQRIQPLASPPSSPVRGTIYVDASLGFGWYDGAAWVYPGSGGGPGYTEIDGNLTLGGKAVSAVPPTTGGPYALVDVGGTWEAVAVLEQPSGGAGSALGDELFTDASGNTYWGNPGNDTLQGGYLGNVNTGAITATINSGTGVLTFTNWPTADVVWIRTSGGLLLRAVVPAAPTPTVSGVTTADYAYVQVHLVPPTTPGGTCTTAITIGTSRTTAALAVADQVGAASTNGSLLVWDGIAHLASSVWTLVAGTPASGSIIPAATGRDRRPWAKGALYAPAMTTAGTQVSFTTPPGWAQRIECSGAPMQVEFGFIYAPSGAGNIGVQFVFDSTTEFSYTPSESALGWAVMGFPFSPAAGSHLFTCQLQNPNAALFGVWLRIFENLQVNTGNGSA